MPGSFVSIEFNFSEIEKAIEQTGKDVASIEKTATQKAADIVASAVKDNLTRRHYGPKDKRSSPEYVHMKDDIHISALKEDEDGDKVREIYGGKKTGYKWRFLNDGTSKMQGTQFADRSVLETEQQVQDTIEKEVEKAIGS